MKATFTTTHDLGTPVKEPSGKFAEHLNDVDPRELTSELAEAIGGKILAEGIFDWKEQDAAEQFARNWAVVGRADVYNLGAGGDTWVLVAVEVL